MPRRPATPLSHLLLGPDASRAETLLGLGTASVAALGAPLLAFAQGQPWTLLQALVAAVLAFDVVGGAIVNGSTAARRFYFAPHRTRRDHLAFVGLHGVHILVALLAFGTQGPGASLSIAVLATLVLLAAAAAVLHAPTYLRRPVAIALLIAGTATTVPFSPLPGLDWFVPVLLLKLLVAYLLGDLPAAPPRQASRA